MSFIVQQSPTAEADLECLFDFLLERAQTTEDLNHAQAAIDTIRAMTQQQLAVTPYSFRKAAQGPVQRGLTCVVSCCGRRGLKPLAEKAMSHQSR